MSCFEAAEPGHSGSARVVAARRQAVGESGQRIASAGRAPPGSNVHVVAHAIIGVQMERQRNDAVIIGVERVPWIGFAEYRSRRTTGWLPRVLAQDDPELGSFVVGGDTETALRAHLARSDADMIRIIEDSPNFRTLRAPTRSPPRRATRNGRTQTDRRGFATPLQARQSKTMRGK